MLIIWYEKSYTIAFMRTIDSVGVPPPKG